MSILPESLTTMAMPQSDVAAALRQIAGAPDLAEALAALGLFVASCMPPGSRADVLGDGPAGGPLLFSTDPAPPPEGHHSADDMRAALAALGFREVIAAPLDGPDRRAGWLLLAQPTSPADAELPSAAAQLAAVLAARLRYEERTTELEELRATAGALRQQVQATEEVRTRATLAAGAAHDIGNLFASVLGHIQLLRQYAPATIQPDLRTVEQAARDGHHLLRRMLTSRLPSFDMPMAPVSPVRQTIDDAVRLTEPFWMDRRAISVVTEVPQLPPVAAHQADLREVLINLILNGIAAMPDGGVLTIRAAAQGDGVAITVSDTGIGIEQAVQRAIFQPVVSTRNGGSGLGLSGSRAVIESYGGSLDVESAPGQGACFIISMPRAR